MPLTLSSLYQPKQRCVIARVSGLYQVSLSTGEATFPRASGPLAGTGPRLYEKTRRPMLCSGSRCRVPASIGELLYTGQPDRGNGWAGGSADILQMLMMTMDDDSRHREGRKNQVTAGGCLPAVMALGFYGGRRPGDIPGWNNKGSGRSGCLGKLEIWG